MLQLGTLVKGGLLGALLGLLYAGMPARIACAQATLCFPPRIPLPQYSAAAKESAKETPLTWAEKILASKAAINYLCAKFEKSELTNRQEIVRVACLLVTEKRVRLESYQDYCLRVQVEAEKPEVALVLCQNLVGFLAMESKHLVEDEAKVKTEEMGQVENQLRVLEKNLSASLWRQLAIDSEPAPPELAHTSAAELMEFQLKVLDYRDLLGQRFYGDVQAAADQPAFCVVEPAYIAPPRRPWALAAGVGSLAGALLGILMNLWRIYRERRISSPPVAREPWIIRRSTR